MCVETLTQTLSADGCHTATDTSNMWTAFHVWMKYASRRMQDPPPATQDGRDEFYRTFVRSSFLKKAHKEGYSLGFEGLFLNADFTEAGIDACVYMREHYDDRADQTIFVQINRCLGKKEFLECRLVTPRYVFPTGWTSGLRRRL